MERRYFHTPIVWQDITKAPAGELLDEYAQCIIAREVGAMNSDGEKVFDQMHTEILRRAAIETPTPSEPPKLPDSTPLTDKIKRDAHLIGTASDRDIAKRYGASLGDTRHALQVLLLMDRIRWDDKTGAMYRPDDD